MPLPLAARRAASGEAKAALAIRRTLAAEAMNFILNGLGGLGISAGIERTGEF